MELMTFETLGCLLAAKLAWSLLVFLKNLLTGWGLCGSVDPKSLGDWAVGACVFFDASRSACRLPAGWC
jgi:hypothetical protein